MNLTCENFRAIIYYDFRRNLTPKQCIDQLTSTFEDEAPSKTTLYHCAKNTNSHRTPGPHEIVWGEPNPALNTWIVWGAAAASGRRRRTHGTLIECLHCRPGGVRAKRIEVGAAAGRHLSTLGTRRRAAVYGEGLFDDLDGRTSETLGLDEGHNPKRKVLALGIAGRVTRPWSSRSCPKSRSTYERGADVGRGGGDTIVRGQFNFGDHLCAARAILLSVMRSNLLSLSLMLKGGPSSISRHALESRMGQPPNPAVEQELTSRTVP
ncbi:hypothetical protein EVAR_24239_1 [Eumeta japonica]|uniref:Mos1 transposase HTH domain-containing protein n=1 Tax=Eumeta variegata TaxID=151549 RepID=A0A4C1W7C6_EUMVA|nr:hypothetical protein EVAR_24239_1 [Eumeta japonica]